MNCYSQVLAPDANSSQRPRNLVKRLICTLLFLNLVACGAEDKRPHQAEKLFQLMDQTKQPADVLADCMLKSTKREAASQMGYIGHWEGTEKIQSQSFPTLRPIDGKGLPELTRYEKMIEDAAEALAVHCGADRDAWRERSKLDMDSALDQISEQKLRSFTYGAAHAAYMIRLNANIDFLSGWEQSANRRQELAAQVEHLDNETKAREEEKKKQRNDRMRDFAVQTSPN